MKSEVRICMIGAGRVGKNHSNALRHVSAGRVAALVDPVEETLRQTGDEFGIDARFTTLSEALDKADFDAVVITTPTFTHKPLVEEAAAHKKHVFLEKPMALNLQECDAILDAVRRHGVFLQLGFMRRFDPDFVTAAQRIQAGEIGEPMMIKSLTHCLLYTSPSPRDS